MKIANGVAGLHVSRRAFLSTGAVAVATPLMMGSPKSRAASFILEGRESRDLTKLPLGFHSYIKNGHLGHSFEGGRAYNSKIMRFMQIDSMAFSPFGAGGVHGYAFVNNDPTNLRDPSGNFAIISTIIGAVVGLVVGAAVSAVSESIRMAATGEKFDWKQVAIGAAVGFVSGGIGAAASGASVGVKTIAAVSDSVISGAAEFGLSMASGYDAKDAGISAGVGAAVSLVTFGVGVGISSRKTRVAPSSVNSNMSRSTDSIPMSVLSGDNPRSGIAPSNVASRTNSRTSISSVSSNSSISSATNETPFPLEGMMEVHLLRDHLVSFLDDASLGNLSSLNRNFNSKLDTAMTNRMKTRYLGNKKELIALQQSYKSKVSGNVSTSLNEITDLIKQKFMLASKQRRIVESWVRQFPSDHSVSYTDGLFNIIG